MYGDLYSFNPHGVLHLISGVSIMSLGVFVLTRQTRWLLRLSFFFVCLAVGTWLLGFGMASMSAQDDVARFWSFVGFIGVMYISTCNYFFTVSLLKKFQAQRWLVGLTFVATTLFFFQMMIDPSFFLGAQRFWWGYYPHWGILSALPFLLFFFTVILGAYGQYIRAWRVEKDPVERKKILTVFLVYVFVYLSALDYLAVFGIPFYPTGPIWVLVWTAVMAYLIVRHELLSVTPQIAAPAIIASIPDALLIADIKGKIVITNEAAVQMLAGKEGSEKDVEGKLLDLFLPDAEKLWQESKSKRGTTILQSLETKLVSTKGKKIPVSLSAATVRDASGAVVGVAVVGHDLRQLQKAFHDLEVQKKALEEANAKLSQRTEEAEQLNKVAVGRELKMMELKKRIEELEKKA